jgi:transcriptional regulator with XRE-family HTH domain
MGKRRSKSERPQTLIRTYVADNVADLRDKVYDSDRFKSPTARNRQLAADSGVSKNQIDRILDKSQGTSIDQLEWLAGALGVRPQDLVTPYFTREHVTPITAKRGKPRSS